MVLAVSVKYGIGAALSIKLHNGLKHDKQLTNMVPTNILIIADPNLLPRLQVDKGAIKFILSGANIMAPGLTSPGARMDIDLPADTVVVSNFLVFVCY